MKELLKVLEFTADRTQALADSQPVAGEPLQMARSENFAENSTFVCGSSVQVTATSGLRKRHAV